MAHYESAQKGSSEDHQNTMVRKHQVILFQWLQWDNLPNPLKTNLTQWQVVSSTIQNTTFVGNQSIIQKTKTMHTINSSTPSTGPVFLCKHP